MSCLQFWLLALCLHFGSTVAVLAKTTHPVTQTFYNAQGQPTHVMTANFYTPSNDYGPILIHDPAVFGQHQLELHYNCHYMPYICANARDWMQANPGYVNGGAMSLHIDVLERRTDTRRSEAGCRNFAKSACPNPNRSFPLQPDGWTVLTQLAGTQYEMGFIPGARSGRAWSCEEFPPASFIEGGAGAQLGCAPIRAQCAFVGPLNRDEPTTCQPWRGNPPMYYKSSEQNWQGTAHNLLRAACIASQPEMYINGQKSVGPCPVNVHLLDDATSDYAAAIVTKDGTYKGVYFNGGTGTETYSFSDPGSNPNNPGQPLSKRENQKSKLKTNETRHHGHGVIVHQDLTDYPPIPILSLSTLYIQGNLNITGNRTRMRNSTRIAGATTPPSGASKSFANAIGRTKKRFEVLADGSIMAEMLSTNSSSRTTLVDKRISALSKRDGPVQCGPGNPCADGSCCNTSGKCGFGPGHCDVPSGTCISQCDAKAMCGIDSVGGKKCGLNLCCSYYGWCGTDDLHCGNNGGDAPCQNGYGSCSVVPPPSCDPNSGSSSGRTVGFYQASNTYNRACDRVSPSQLNTTGFTHLNFAFVYFDPISFQVVPADSRDEPLLKQFTSLKSSTLQTWVSVGGWAFTEPGSTQAAWSTMSSSSANRAAFIGSLKSFMSQYGFQGVDLGWEYPAEAIRGGADMDTANLVSLVQEMRAAFGSTYGISVVLAPDYWYLRGFDPKKMEPYVDFFGFMGYDLHGPWDVNVKSLGPIVNPHTSALDITNDLLPLWFDNLNPAKVNLGIAAYGRSFKLSDPGCAHAGCTFTGPGDAGSCTSFPGVLSLTEIKRMIQSQGLTPTLVPDAMVKTLVYGQNNWVAYDDPDTFALKRQLANKFCLGGTMMWSVDFLGDSGTDGTPGASYYGTNSTGNDYYLSQSMWLLSSAIAACYFPCRLIPAPLGLPSAVTFRPTPIVAILTNVDVATTTVTTSIFAQSVLSTVTIQTVSTIGSTTFTTTITPRPVITNTVNIMPLVINAIGSATTISPSAWIPLVTQVVTQVISSKTKSWNITIPVPIATTFTLPKITVTQGPPRPICSSKCGILPPGVDPSPGDLKNGRPKNCVERCGFLDPLCITRCHTAPDGDLDIHGVKIENPLCNNRCSGDLLCIAVCIAQLEGTDTPCLPLCVGDLICLRTCQQNNRELGMSNSDSACPGCAKPKSNDGENNDPDPGLCLWDPTWNGDDDPSDTNMGGAAIRDAVLDQTQSGQLSPSDAVLLGISSDISAFISPGYDSTMNGVSVQIPAIQIPLIPILGSPPKADPGTAGASQQAIQPDAAPTSSASPANPSGSAPQNNLRCDPSGSGAANPASSNSFTTAAQNLCNSLKGKQITAKNLFSRIDGGTIADKNSWIYSAAGDWAYCTNTIDYNYCYKALSQIISGCPNNGGMYSDNCVTWFLQTRTNQPNLRPAHTPKGKYVSGSIYSSPGIGG